MRAASVPFDARWRPWSTDPPKIGEILVWVKRAGIESYMVVHYQPGGHCIEDHPSIAEGWYYWTGHLFDYLRDTPKFWMPLPNDPTDKFVCKHPGMYKEDNGIWYCICCDAPLPVQPRF